MVYKQIQVVYIVKQWKNVFGINLYPHSEIICETYEAACRELAFFERRLVGKGWKRFGVREQIRHTEPIDVEIEYRYEKFGFFQQRIEIQTWCVLS